MVNELPPVRRVVTGLDAAGQSVFVADGPAPSRTNPAPPGWRLSQPWATGQAPAAVDDPDRTPDLRGVLPPSWGAEEFARCIAADIERWRNVAKLANMKPNDEEAFDDAALPLEN